MIKKIIKWIPFCLLYIPFKIYSLFNRNKKNILLFGTGTGLYHDNSKYLFEYLLEQKSMYKEYKIFWVATNKETYTILKNKGVPVLYRNSILCAKYAANAKAYFLSSGLLDVFWFINKQTLLIQLWHGTPIKKIAFDSPTDLKKLINKKKFFNYNYQFNRYDYLIIEDNKYKKIFKSAFKISESKILGLGQARNLIFNENNSTLITPIKDRLNISSFQKIILYAPTFRDKMDLNIQLIKTILKEETINFLKLNNYCLIVKLHPFLSSNTEIKDFLQGLGASVKNIVDVIDIQELLIISDAIVTDISSFALDYLQYSTNLYKYFPDEKDYIDIRGSFYEYTFKEMSDNSITINSIKEIEFNQSVFQNYSKDTVCEDIMQLLKDDSDKDIQKRKRK